MKIYISRIAYRISDIAYPVSHDENCIFAVQSAVAYDYS